MSITSTYEGVETTYEDTTTEVLFEENTVAYLEYKFTVAATRDPASLYIQVCTDPLCFVRIYAVDTLLSNSVSYRSCSGR